MLPSMALFMGTRHRHSRNITATGSSSTGLRQKLSPRAAAVSETAPCMGLASEKGR